MSARYDRMVKRVRYQRADVPEYWIVDLNARVVERWRAADARPEILSEMIAWVPEGADAGCEIDLSQYFEIAAG